MSSGASAGVESFRPLDFVRTIGEDHALDVYEYAVLVAMAMGTDNATFKVRRRLGSIATAAKVHSDTVSRCLTRAHVLRYVERIERPNPRRCDVWLRQEPASTTSRSQWVDIPLPAGSGAEGAQRKHPAPSGKGSRPQRVDIPLPAAPSALSAPSASSTTNSKPSPFAKVLPESSGEGDRPSHDDLRNIGWTFLEDRPEPTRQEGKAMAGHERMLRDEQYTGDEDPSLATGSVSGYRSRRVS